MGRWGTARRLVAVIVLVVAGVGARAPGAQASDRPLTRVSATPGATTAPGDPVVALTFDDGPDPRWTPQILDILARYRVPATFFAVGSVAARHPDLLAREARAGHSVENHTWDHVKLTSTPAGGYPHQVDDTTRLVEDATHAPVRCARPPYGAVDATVVDRLAARGLAAVTWSVDPTDYRRPGADAIAARVLDAARPDGIVLLHDGGGDRSQTVAALPRIIEGLRARGYRFASICGTPPSYRALLPAAAGTWRVRSDGRVDPLGGALALGGVDHPARPLVGGAASPDGRGYWLAGADGGVFSFGDAGFSGSLGGVTLNQPVVGMAATPSGGGYWLVASDGGVFSFGDARFLGSTGGVALNRPVVGMAATPSGGGYWLVASDGGVFSFGDARFEGSTGGVVLQQPVVAMAATPTGGGYWLAAGDGGVFTFGDAPFAGAGVRPGHDGATGVAATRDGSGYWIVSGDGGVRAFGTAADQGDPPA